MKRNVRIARVCKSWSIALLLPLALALLAGCVIDKDIGDEPDTAGVPDGGGTGGDTGGTGGDTGGTGGDTGGGSDGGTGGDGGPWSTKSAMPTARRILTSSTAGGIIYAIGGATSQNNAVDTVEAYDPITNTWTTKTAMLTVRLGLTSSVVNGIVYAIGGCSNENYCGGPVNAMEAYVPATDTWSTNSPLPTARGGVASSAVDGVLYVIGGAEFDAGMNTMEAYDPATDTWSAKSPMLTARWGLTSSVANGVIYAIGGCLELTNAWYDCGMPLNTVEAYDPATDTWSTKSPMPTARWGLTSSVVNGVVYAIGGCSVDQSVGCDGTSDAVEAYDPATDKWTTKASMPTARGGLTSSAVNGVIYAIGGQGDFDFVDAGQDTVEAYDPSLDP